MKPDNIEYNREQVKSYIQSIRNCKPVSAIYDARDFNGEIQMSKYIEAADAAEKISEQYGIPFWELVDVFRDIPVADVREIVRARWKYDVIKETVCSVCGESALIPRRRDEHTVHRTAPTVGLR